MDVSKRIKELRGTIDNATIAPIGKSAIKQQIRQFEVEIVKAIQTAAAKGYDAGYLKGFEDGYNNTQMNIEWEYAEHHPD